MITIKASNGSRGSGETIAAACRNLLGDQRMSVRSGRATFVPVEDATVSQVLHSGAVYVMKGRSWRVGVLVDEVNET